MSWNSIIAQQRAKKILMNAVSSGRVSHAYLFYGPAGVGKDAVAIEFAKVLNCDVGGDTSCDSCDSCSRFRSLQHPNLVLVFPVPLGKGEKAGDSPLAKLSQEDLDNVREQVKLKAADHYYAINVPRATTIKVNSIRSVKREASLTPYRKGTKVTIIICAEQMNEESSSALLKTLEEPIENTVFILTTAQRDQLFPTVISRCQGIRFDPLTENEITLYLQEKHGVESSRAKLVGRLAHGSLSRALKLLDADLQEQREKTLQYLRTLYAGDEVQFSRQIEDMVRDYDRNEIEQFLQILQLWIRDAFCLKEGFDSIVNIDQRDSIERFVKNFPRLHYEETLERIDHAISLLNRNVYIPLILTTLSLDIKNAIFEKV